MDEQVECPSCPTCLRELTGVLEYPAITITKLDIRPMIGEHQVWTLEGYEDAKTWHRSTLEALNKLDCIQTYLDKVKGLLETKIKAHSLKPELPASSYFKFAHKLPKKEVLEVLPQGVDNFTSFFLALSDDKPGVCSVSIFETGPNFGSAGGPSLQLIGKLATIYYKGHLVKPNE